MRLYNYETSWMEINKKDIVAKKDNNGYNTYVFSDQFIKNSDINKYINKTFWVYEKDFSDALLVTLIEEEGCGLYFDDAYLPNVEYIILNTAPAFK